MFQFIKESLMWRLAIMLFTGALLSIIIVTVLVFHYSGKSLEQEVFKRLSAVNKIKKKQIVRYLKEKKDDLKILSESRDTMEAFELLQSYHLASQNADSQGSTGRFDIDSKEYKAINKKINPFFRQYGEIYDYDNIFLICKIHGHIIYTLSNTTELGINLGANAHKSSGMADVWKKVRENKDTVISDIEIYEPTGKASFFIGIPVTDQDKNIHGVLCVVITIGKINRIIHEITGIGETEDTHLVGVEDYLVRAGFEIDNILKKEIKLDGNKAGTEKALNYNESNESSEVLRSKPLIMGLQEELGTDFDWVIISEITKKEAYTSIRNLRNIILKVGIFLSIFSCIAGYFLARYIVTPLKTLSEKVVAMADGDLTITISHGARSDEVGRLMNAFYYTLSTIRNQIQQIMDGTNTIATSISQISTTATQLAASASETSSSVNEITTTVEEVRQTAQISNEKAGYVAQSAERAAQISEAGRKATEDAISGMSHIKEEMEYVAESIIELSEQTQSIGEIISAVNDLADQSNLLSVNASIEAAKAGEQGKGFAVVAQEVKSLADQSKEATNQVKTILNDIQRATGAAVMATERGTKAVETGVELSALSDNSITQLSESVTEAAQAAIQIAASSQEQLIGMDQLARAMQSIKDASIQNVDSARQLESAAKKLEDLGQGLKQLASMYNV
ncbi:MAG: methyl-accepting chemotaxis protein [Desulfobacteraceae bacterium]|nr:methyl-accepting chemotaxis protein [Desulfobacteraceae bacterium]